MPITLALATCQELNDLLSLNGARLELRQAMCSSGCHVAGLTQVPLTLAPEAMSVLARGIANRRVTHLHRLISTPLWLL